MRGTRRIVRHRLRAAVLGATLVVSTSGGVVQAKVTDFIGQDPTALYDDGRAADLRAAIAPAYQPGISFQIGAIEKFHVQPSRSDRQPDDPPGAPELDEQPGPDDSPGAPELDESDDR